MKKPIIYNIFKAQNPSFAILAISPLNSIQTIKTTYITASTKLILYTAETPKQTNPPPLSYNIELILTSGQPNQLI